MLSFCHVILITDEEEIMKEYIGIDIGGTKCAVVRGDEQGTILEKIRFPTQDKERTLTQILRAARQLWTGQITAIGVSCGGPLDCKNGLILSPPNLPGWDQVPITELLSKHFHVPTYLENDANACAVAEWKFGAGEGCENMIFLTFGTGLGAGLILNGRLYEGSCGMAGEVGHVRLFDQGHIGYGKAGSYEGYCSGGGIAQYGLGSAARLAELAASGDKEALRIWKSTGYYLGKLLSLLIDILNPDKIVIGSIYVRANRFMADSMYEVLKAETLTKNLDACMIVPASLGESLGDMAALSAAINGRFEQA